MYDIIVMNVSVEVLFDYFVFTVMPLGRTVAVAGDCLERPLRGISSELRLVVVDLFSQFFLSFMSVHCLLFVVILLLH